jgi:hypothetical protein
MKIFQVEDELFCADGKTDVLTNIKKLTAAFCNFSDAPKSIAGRRLLIVTHYATGTAAQFWYFYSLFSSYPWIFNSTENIYGGKVHFVFHVSKSQKFCSFV